MCSGVLSWLFSPAWDAVKLTLKVGFICPFVVDDPTDLGATIVVAQALCCPSSTYPLRREPAFLPMVIKLTCLCFSHCVHMWNAFAVLQSLYSHVLTFSDLMLRLCLNNYVHMF